jgi:hypothetical protein
MVLLSVFCCSVEGEGVGALDASETVLGPRVLCDPEEDEAEVFVIEGETEEALVTDTEAALWTPG